MKKLTIQKSLQNLKPAAPAMNEVTQKHLHDAYRYLRNAYSFLLAENQEYARQQLSFGLSHLDRVIGPWLKK